MKTLMRPFLAAAITLLSFSASAQNKTVDLGIDIPLNKKPHSLYSSISILDERKDTTNLGSVDNYESREKEKVVPLVPLSTQIQQLMTAATDQTAENGRLLLLLQQFNLQAIKAKGYCYLKAELYAEQNGTYIKLASIDTVKIVKDDDVTTGLLSSGRGMIPKFITDHLQTKASGNEKFTLSHLQHMDSLLRSKYALYRADTLKEGIYKTYNSFKNQEPDITQFEANFYKGNIKYLALKGKKGKFDEPMPEGYYAFVNKDRPYIITLYGFYPLEKKNGDFFFDGKYRAARTRSDAEIIFTALRFGLIGFIGPVYTLVNGPGMIDYETGDFIVPEKEKKKK